MFINNLKTNYIQGLLNDPFPLYVVVGYQFGVGVDIVFVAN